MPKDFVRKPGLIGPNAILQLLPVLEQAGGAELRDQVMAAAGLMGLPSDAGMMPEGPVARMHQALRAIEPEMAPSLAWAAGVRTAQYVMTYRIPRGVNVFLKILPARFAGPLLTKAVAKYAWTFAGSGQFSVVGPMSFEIADNPIVRGEHSDVPLCDWHRAVFETMFRTFVDDRLRCDEVTCCAMGASACRFVLRPSVS